jgi:hypothetical protein
MVRLARRANLPHMVPVDGLQHAHPRKDHRSIVLRSSVTICAAAWTFGVVCSDFGISFASQAMAS